MEEHHHHSHHHHAHHEDIIEDTLQISKTQGDITENIIEAPTA
jgi:hypothetical protein